MTTPDYHAMLELRFDSDAGKNLSIREYMAQLLLTLWDEEEGFSGKRPFGNSNWTGDVYTPLIKAGHLPGELDSDGYIAWMDEAAGKSLVHQLIKEATGTQAAFISRS